MILTDKELERLTGRKRPSAQKRELVALGIPFRVRTDGSIVVASNWSQQPASRAPAPKLRLPA